jgi:hypothetical protein
LDLACVSLHGELFGSLDAVPSGPPSLLLALLQGGRALAGRVDFTVTNGDQIALDRECLPGRALAAATTQISDRQVRVQFDSVRRDPVLAMDDIEEADAADHCRAGEVVK